MRLTEDAIAEEMTKIHYEETSGLGWMWRVSIRFLVRSLRVLAGLVVFGLGWWSGASAVSRLSVPFAAQNLIGLAAGIGLAILALWLFSMAFSCAFGPGPDREESNARKRQKAVDRLSAKIWERAVNLPVAASRPRHLDPTDVGTRREPRL